MLTDKITDVTPSQPFITQKRDERDGRYEDAVQRKFMMASVANKMANAKSRPLQKYTHATSGAGGVTSNQEYGWYSGHGGHMPKSAFFHKPVKSCDMTVFANVYY